MGLFSNAKEKIYDFIQKQGGKLAEDIMKDIKIKSFNSISLKLGKIEISFPEVKIKSDNFKLKIIDKSTGKAISDIPIPLDIRVGIPDIMISLPEEMKIEPKIDMSFKNK